MREVLLTMINTLRVVLFSLSLALLMSACGGGGGGGGTDQPPSISTQPANITVVAGNKASFSVIASGTSLSYQWQIDIGSGFANITDAGVYSGSTTATLSLSSITIGMNNYKYRVIVNGSVAPAATSNSATLTVTAPTKAALTLSIPSLPAGTLVSGIQFTIKLPSGVSPAVVDTGGDASGSITLTGGATGGLNGAGYDAVDKIITFGTISFSSFGAGNFLLINCVIAPGSTVAASNFSLNNVQVFDSNGTQIPNATISIAVQFSE